MKPFLNCAKLNDLVTLIVIFMLNIAILDFVAIGAFLFHKHILNKVMMTLLSSLACMMFVKTCLYLCQIMDSNLIFDLLQIKFKVKIIAYTVTFCYESGPYLLNYY